MDPPVLSSVSLQPVSISSSWPLAPRMCWERRDAAFVSGPLSSRRFGFVPGTVELYTEKIAARGLCAIAQAERLRYKLIGTLAVRRSCYGVLHITIMESRIKDCEVAVSGKLRAKSMKFVDDE